MAAMPAPKGLGLQNLTKLLAHVGVLLGHLLSLNHVLKVSDLGPPPLNLRWPGGGKINFKIYLLDLQF